MWCFAHPSMAMAMAMTIRGKHIFQWIYVQCVTEKLPFDLHGRSLCCNTNAFYMQIHIYIYNGPANTSHHYWMVLDEDICVTWLLFLLLFFCHFHRSKAEWMVTAKNSIYLIFIYDMQCLLYIVVDWFCVINSPRQNY